MKHHIQIALLASLTLSILPATALAMQGDTGLQVQDQEAKEWKAPRRKARVKNPMPANEESLAIGKKLFAMGCVACHGEAGEGNGVAAPALVVQPSDLSAADMWKQTDGELYWKVSTGRTPMPTFEAMFTSDERWHIVNYMRSLAPKPRIEPKSGHLLDRVVTEAINVQGVLVGASKPVTLTGMADLSAALADLELVKKESVPKDQLTKWGRSKQRLQAAAVRLATAKTLKETRLAYAQFYAELIPALQRFGYGGPVVLRVFRCEHALGGGGVDWIQIEKSIANPYRDEKESNCGVLSRTFGRVAVTRT